MKMVNKSRKAGRHLIPSMPLHVVHLVLRRTSVGYAKYKLLLCMYLSLQGVFIFSVFSLQRSLIGLHCCN